MVGDAKLLFIVYFMLYDINLQQFLSSSPPSQS